MPVGFSEDGEKTWWQAVYRHLKEAEVASMNAMAHNLDSQVEVFALQDVIEDALKKTQAICKQKNIRL